MSITQKSKVDCETKLDPPAEDDTIVTMDDVSIMKEVLTKLDLDGVLVYKNASINNCFGIIDELGDLDYCACCSCGTISSIKTYDVGGKTFVVIDIDACSG